MNKMIKLPNNEPVLNYSPQSEETKILKRQLDGYLKERVDIPVIVNGKEIRTGKLNKISPPHDHRKELGVYHNAGRDEIVNAINGAEKAWKDWSTCSASERAAVFLKAAELLKNEFRPILNATTMLGQSKTCYQAEIDSACELIDFFNFNVSFMEQILAVQPISGPGQKNHLEYRALEGFVFAVSPFNFTSITGNLVGSPALMGNVVLLKPASTAVYSAYFIYKLLEKAGLPPGVLQFLPGSGSEIGNTVLKDKRLAGIHFTGSTGVFQGMWKTVGENIREYRSYPRIVGETGGKDFVFAHPSADVKQLGTALIRGSFEYQGQKCSAASRAYIPKSIWTELKDFMVSELKTMKIGDVCDFKNFMGAVIDKKSFDNIRSYIEDAKKNATIIAGGNCNDEVGYFVEPTVIQVNDPKYRSMCDEIFGPVLSIYVYDDNKYEETLKICESTSPYALTGAFISQDKKAVEHASKVLLHAAGNFYINNKPTGAVVGQQPFGGARGSGTNDKAGSVYNLIRWVSARTVSETFEAPRSFRYPFME